MNNLSAIADRFLRQFLIYCIFIAIIVVGIPSFIVLMHSTDSEKPVVSARQPINIVKQTKKINPVSASSHVLSLGWTIGNSGDLTGYTHLQIVSQLFATIGTLNQVRQETSDSIISKLHSEGEKVWGRISMASQVNSATHQFLVSPVDMKQAVQKIRIDAAKSHLDGVNLDIENVRAGDRGSFVDFIINLSQALKQENIKLSVDVQPETGGTPGDITSFNKILGEYCDYIIFMGYDEHWATDPNPGPVTSLQWLKDNLQQFIKTGIPSQKLILGLPSYTRIWQVDANGGTVSSQAVSSEYLDTLALQEHLHEQWDPIIGAYYISYSKGGKQFEIWLTNTRSLLLYLQLISDYHLAGYGFWNLNLMSPNGWNKLSASISFQ